MAFDAHKNLAITTVATAPAPATSGTTLTVAVGEGARFPVAPFNATVWPVSALPTPVNAEVVRVTARTGDVLTITRAQEGTTARSIIAGDFIAETITAKALTDIESGTNFPLLTTPGSVTAAGQLVLNGTDPTIRTATPPGADDKYLLFISSGAVAQTRGAYFAMYGNQVAGAGGALTFVAGDMPTGTITFNAGAAERVRFHRSGGVSIGSAFDPGAATLHLTAAAAAAPNLICAGPGVGQNFPVSFQNANGQVGYIGTLASATQYSTTSDARLKTSRGRHTDPDVLRKTVIHDFTWNADGTPGRGVFAQEAASVLPCAVSVGGDEIDDQGRLKNPWGVDYSKYVPDLITGWQAHEEDLLDLRAEVYALTCQVTAATPASPLRMTLWQRVRTAFAVMFPAWITP